MPANVASAEGNALNPFVGLVIFLMNRWSCSTMLLRYLICLTVNWMNRPPNIDVLALMVLEAGGYHKDKSGQLIGSWLLANRHPSYKANQG